MAVQRDGKIVAVGTAGTSAYAAARVLVRYRVTGQLDPSFGRGGKVVTRVDGETLSAVAIQRDGKIVVLGQSTGGFGRPELLRYTAGGRLDPSFGRGGAVVANLPFEDVAYQLALQRDGKIVVAGSGGDEFVRTHEYESSDFVVARFTSGGALDESFGSGGVAVTDFGGPDELMAIAVQADGKIVAAGYSDRNGRRDWDFALVRYSANGELDTTFGSGGKVLTDLRGNSSDWAGAVAIQPDGKIVVAGTFGRDGFALLRYTRAGKLDATFGARGKVLSDLARDASAVTIQTDGRILAGGHALVRYTTAGKPDLTFGKRGVALTDFGGNDSISALAFQKDGKIIAAGTNGSSFVLARYTK